MQRKLSAFPCPGTLVCEAQEVKGFGFAFAALFSSLGRVASKFDQARLFSVELQAKFGKAFLEFFQALPGFVFVLESYHEVIRITHNYYISTAAVLPPPYYPGVKDVMQKHVRE